MMSSSAASNEKIVLKIVVLGASNVGKSSLMKRYASDKFSDTRRVTGKQ
jgi:GTPase SAR1 family protein